MGETAPAKRSRQFGAERRSEPLAIMHSRPSGGAVTWARLAIVITVLAWVLYMVTTIMRMVVEGPTESFVFHVQTWIYGLTVTMLSFSALMYLVARFGALVRFRDHRRVERGRLDEHFSDSESDITVLIPSYDEEPEVVLLTVWSAALQEFPSKRIVLLIDDNASRMEGEALQRLQRTRDIPNAVMERLRVPADAARSSLERFRAECPERPGPGDARRAADAYAEAAAWLDAFAIEDEPLDNMAEFFKSQVLLGLSSDLRLTKLALDAAAAQGTSPDRARLEQLHRRLSWIFTVHIDSFERRQYASLSQEHNKAMNLNSYISLMGGRYQIDRDTGERILRAVREDEPAELEVPDSTYLLTLDADSQLLREYCLRLVYLLEQPENGDVAVTQTPYSAFRGAPTRIERIAGATTDIQHIQHQGMSYYDATFWVGANAVIRKGALEDIATVETSGGFTITTYVQDRTVIEDTESSIDLGVHGWRLVNYPERLSYSATPPDFGSLVVQRRRWANGGLLILPKFFEQIRARKRTATRARLSERLLRANYMASLAWASFGLLFLLFFPFDSRLLSPLVIAAALPYFVSMGLDLKESGHRFGDIFRIYGFNLILLPVNLAGVLKSMQQGVTGEKIPFVRTPKVSGRTASPALYVAVPFLIIGFSVITVVRDYFAQNWGNAAFAAFNAVMATWATVAFIGVWNAIVDFFMGIVNWLFVPRRATKRRDAKRSEHAPVPETEVDWQAILYHGDRRLRRDLVRPADRRRRLKSLASPTPEQSTAGRKGRRAKQSVPAGD